MAYVNIDLTSLHISDLLEALRAQYLNADDIESIRKIIRDVTPEPPKYPAFVVTTADKMKYDQFVENFDDEEFFNPTVDRLIEQLEDSDVDLTIRQLARLQTIIENYD